MSEYNPIAKQYEEAILTGQIPAGELLRLAVERQVDDLKYGHKRGLFFDHEAGQRILDFFGLINLEPNTPLSLAPWQVWELYVFYGWKRYDGYRRFRYKYKSVARKNGKTPLESAQILYHLTVEDLFRAEAYVSATKEDQAKICFDDAKFMLEYSPDLQDALSASAETIFNPENKSKFTFLTSNPKTADGTRPSFSVIDEYHEFDNDDMIGKLETGSVHRKQPIMNIVTTRGTDNSKPCFQAENNEFIPILKRIVDDDSTFVLIYSLDIKKDDDGNETGDDWEDPNVWIKANPMIGHILTQEAIAAKLKKAKQKGPEGIVKFKTLNLNMWVDAPTVWIEDEIWQKSGRKIRKEDFKNKGGYAGLDLAKRDDFCSFCLTFERVEDGVVFFDSFWWHWIPEETVKKRISDGLHSLRDWIDKEYIIVTEGTVTDYDVIERTIKEIHDYFNILGCSYDQHNIGNLAINLTNYGIDMSIMPQNMMTLSPPTKELKYAVKEGRYNHGFDPVLRWQISNAVEITDSKENIMITKDKKRAKQKVDGVVAGVIAMGEYLNQNGEVPADEYKRGDMYA